MHIVHISDCYLPRLGGIELHLRDLVDHQRAVGHDVRVLTVMQQATDGPSDPAWLERIPPTSSGLRGQVAEMERRLQAQPVDAVHVHVSVVSPFATMAAQRCAARGLPTLITVHSMWTGFGPLPSVVKSLLGLKRWPVAWSAVSERAAEPLRKMLGSEVEVQVLPNAVAPCLWRTAGRSYAEMWPPGPPTIVSVMRLTHVKRALPLARMLRMVHEQHPDSSLRAVVIGDGPQRKPLERYLRRHHMDGWVELPGRMDRIQIHEHLLHASVFLAPAERESFGIAALEARTVGVPVVASSRSGVGEFITSGVEGLLGATDREMAGHIARLIADDSLRGSIARHNRIVPPKHDWAAAVERADILYAEAYQIARGRVALPCVLTVINPR